MLILDMVSMHNMEFNQNKHMYICIRMFLLTTFNKNFYQN